MALCTRALGGALRVVMHALVAGAVALAVAAARSGFDPGLTISWVIWPPLDPLGPRVGPGFDKGTLERVGGETCGGTGGCGPGAVAGVVSGGWV